MNVSLLSYNSEVSNAVFFESVIGATVRFSNSEGMQILDWVVILVYVSAIILQGWYYSRGQVNSEEFFRASSKPMGAISVGISIFATLLSTISFLGKPGEMINKGPALILAQIVSVPFVYYVVAHMFLPTIMNRRVTSVYEFLEERVGLVGRLSGAGMFVFLRLVWMSLMIYLTSMALSVVVGISEAWTGLVSIVVGAIAIGYSTLGGIRAVVKTDVLQTLLFLTGAIATIVVVTWHCGGFSWFSFEWSDSWDSQPVFTLDPFVRVSLIGSLVHMVLWRVATFCSDQTAVQRYMTLKDLKGARNSLIVTSITTVVSTVILAFVGFALLGFYTQFPSALPQGVDLDSHADQAFPYFISHYLPVGLTGLVVAAFLAAAMSSVDSGVSSIAAVVNTDFLERFGVRGIDDRTGVLQSRLAAIAIGAVAVALSLVVKHVPGNILEVVNKTANLVTVPIFALFILAWFVPFVTPLGALIGTVFGILSGFLVGFWDVLTGGPRISFLYMGVASLFVSLVAGCLISKFGPVRNDTIGNWKWGVIIVGCGFLASVGLVVAGS